MFSHGLAHGTASRARDVTFGIDVGLQSTGLAILVKGTLIGNNETN